MRSPIRGGLSLANKVQLLFGLAVVFIVSATLILPWFRVVAIIDQSEFEAIRQFARFWEARPFIDGSMNVGWYRETTDAEPGPAGAPAPGVGSGVGNGVGAAGGNGVGAATGNGAPPAGAPGATPNGTGAPGASAEGTTDGATGAGDGEGAGAGAGAGQGTSVVPPAEGARPGGAPGREGGAGGGGAGRETPVGTGLDSPPLGDGVARRRATALPHEVLGFWPIADWNTREFRSPFMREARSMLGRVAEPGEPALREFRQAVWADGSGTRVYRLASMITNDAGEAQGVIVVERRSPTAAGQIFVNRLFLVIAGLAAAGFAVGVFFFITKSIILSPVRSLRDTAELVRGGSMHIRSDIRTGDEFEQLAAAFNSMLEAIERQQAQLKRSNRTLDIQVNRLEEQNRQLNEMAKLKGEFLANISHELRTPLNSIIGFAEILDEIADAESRLLAEGLPPNPTPKQVEKRRRYISNIVTAGRRLLEMINELLTMARLEAGRIGVEIGPVNPVDMGEAVRSLIQPLADRAQITVRLELETATGSFTEDPAMAHLPMIETDAKKLHQILFNFLSNAAKFTPHGGLIRIRMEQDDSDRNGRVRMSVIDNGPGIDPRLHATIFEKFRQIDGGHTREHQQGTGLGLAIAKELAEMIGGEITLDSAPGRGSAFALTLPVAFPHERVEAAEGGGSSTAGAGASDAPGDGGGGNPGDGQDDRTGGADGVGGGPDGEASGAAASLPAAPRRQGPTRTDLWRE